MEALANLIIQDTKASPKLLISCFGGARGFTMTDILEREFTSGIGQLATTKSQKLYQTVENYCCFCKRCVGVDNWVECRCAETYW